MDGMSTRNRNWNLNVNVNVNVKAGKTDQGTPPENEAIGGVEE